MWQGDMVRIGGLIFGILPAAGGVKEALARAGATPQRALRWLTTVVSVKVLPPNTCVGYECSGKTKHGTVALLPLGSHDGFLEASLGFKHVVIRSTLLPVLAVDANVVIVEASSEVQVGDTVVILGCDAADTDVCTMPTLSTRIPTHLPRFYV
jgi:alanine racemase